MTYVTRAIHQRLWHSPLFETLSAAERGVYLYLTTGPATSILGVVEATRKRLAFDAAVSEAELDRILAKLEAAGELVVDGDALWLPAFIRRQCTASPKILAALRARLADVRSDVIRRAICAAYPHIMTPRPPVRQYRMDTVSEPSRSDLIIGLKTDRADAAPVEGAPAGTLEADGSREPWRAWSEQGGCGRACLAAQESRRSERPTVAPAGNAYSTPLTVSPEVEAQLRRQFPGVDYDATIARIREYLERTGKPVRNALRYLTACFGNAASPAASAPVAVPPASRPSSAPEPRRAPEKAVPFSFDPQKPLPVPGAKPEGFRLVTPDELRASFAQGIEKIHSLREAIRPRDAAKECIA